MSTPPAYYPADDERVFESIAETYRLTGAGTDVQELAEQFGWSLARAKKAVARLADAGRIIDHKPGE